MTRDELLDKIEDIQYWQESFAGVTFIKAIREVVDLHKPKFYPAGCKDETCCPEFFACENCGCYYPCSTIQAIEKELG